ncbi:MAG: BamA/TamA family outer membrane protein, partial [Sphingomonadales bacterium]|nr:BamA/TamA family outer membrane protein [Sphingomonadales bacterium]
MPKRSERLSGQADGDGIDVELAVTSGPLYHFEQVDLPGLAEAGARADELRAQFEVEEGDPVDARQVVTARAQLRTELGNRGYPFASIGEEEVIVDHASRLAILTQPVEPGGERDFGAITVTEGAEEIFGAEHVATIARFQRGELYSNEMVDDLRRALIQTGLVSRVELTPIDPGDGETVDISVAMQPAPPRTIAGRLGYGTGEGASVEANWEHRNLLGPEGAVGVRAIAGTEEQYLGLSYRRSNFLARDHILTAQIFGGNLYRDAYAARTVGFIGSFERVTTQLWQKRWVWSLGAELLASNERDFIPATGLRERRTFFIGAVPMSLGFDSTNDLLNPEEGFRFGVMVSPEISLQDGTFPYARIQLDGSSYFAAADALTLAGRVRFGAIPGASRENIAPSRRFYAGGGASVRGYSYQSIGPRDAENDPIGGRSLIELSLEARYRFGSFGIVPFIDAGAIYTDIYPDFSGLRFGAGIGARYYSSFG